MKIEIEDRLFLESNGIQYVLNRYSGKHYKDKDGNEREGYQTLGYYGTIKQALKSLVEKKLLESKATTLEELANEVEQIKKTINEKINF